MTQQFIALVLCNEHSILRNLTERQCHRRTISYCLYTSLVQDPEMFMPEILDNYILYFLLSVFFGYSETSFQLHGDVTLTYKLRIMWKESVPVIMRIIQSVSYLTKFS